MRKKLYLIAGTMCNEKLWFEMSPYLDDAFELIYLNVPKGKGFDELAQYYNDTFTEDKVNLIGFSLGGYVATYFAKCFPERIEKLFVISNSPTSLPNDELNQRRDILKYVKAHGYKGMSRKKAENLLDMSSGVTNQTERFVELVMTMDRELGESEFVSQYQYTSEREDLSPAIRQFSFTTHIYYSENDKLINPQWLAGLSNDYGRLSLISTKGSGHMLPLEKAKELSNHIKMWALGL